MSSLVDTAFLEWTKGLDPRESRVSVFEYIRDIPYSLATPATDPRTAPETILSLGKGNCGPKHYLLAALFRRLGLDVVYATFPFLWDDPGLRYPPDLRTLSHGLPVAWHLACRVYIGSRWVLVDATWDPPLEKGGFPVNGSWNGYTETLCAVKPLKTAVRTAFCRTATEKPCRPKSDQVYDPLDGECDHRTAGDRRRFYTARTSLRTPAEMRRIAEFYPAFEAWIVKLRESGNP